MKTPSIYYSYITHICIGAVYLKLMLTTDNSLKQPSIGKAG